MIREINENLITPDKLLSSSQLAKLGCSNCSGCSECCRDREGAVTLDAWDVSLLKQGLNYSFEGLLEQELITLSVVDGVVLPSLCMKPDRDECIFLNDAGRCSIHSFRPGICRMFPLARLYHEDGSFSYFIQEGECSRSNGVKIRISKWLGYEDVKKYETAVRIYHDALTELRRKQADLPHEERTALQRSFLRKWFQEPVSF